MQNEKSRSLENNINIRIIIIIIIIEILIFQAPSIFDFALAGIIIITIINY